MFLYRFVRRRRRRRRRRPQILVHAITFEQLFGFFFHFWHNCWPWPTVYLIRFWSIFVAILTVNFQGQIWNLLYLSQKMVRLPRNEKPNISIEPLGSNGTIRFDLGHDLDLEFSRSNIEFPISRPKMVRLPRNENQTYLLNPWAQMWPFGLTLAMTLTLHFQGLIWNLLYLSHKWSNCHETKSKHIDWTPGLKCDQWVWPWPWPWPLNFEGQIWPWHLTTHMTLTMDFHGQIFK